ncbi:GNAT superfamily N-acetyltransferase [Rhabdobacter roseus]|uniref:GNAT superfamily N-acetyltransferase n=1 Tax=Rhabdobacter roseus TaxID=1655419 RepID=A0A840TTU0_9BACT|nr:GNAT family N-acetyltransferase [Rhabdobacter roseus]MBB5285087.1 GNAT superfamily N-acetyltransferase [Rhabdobacter roseus]
MPQRFKLVDQDFILEKIEYPDRIDEIGALRINAWREEKGINTAFFSRSSWIEELDQEAHHWIVTKDNVAIASARMSFHYSFDSIPYIDLLYGKKLDWYDRLPVASINRLVVSPAYRGMGLANLLDKIRVEYAIQAGARLITAQPLESRVQSLGRLGFSLIDQLEPPFQIPERRIYFMIKEVD